MLILALTTAPTAATAEALARGAVEARLAACAQVDGPRRSFFHWEGRVAAEEEWRVSFKAPTATAAALGHWVAAHHPYTTPQWIVFSASEVAENYLQWARESCHTSELRDSTSSSIPPTQP